MQDYTIVSGNNLNEISQRVKSQAEKGFTPLGGVSVTFNQSTNTHTFFQSMVKN